MEQEDQEDEQLHAEGHVGGGQLRGLMGVWRDGSCRVWEGEGGDAERGAAVGALCLRVVSLVRAVAAVADAVADEDGGEGGVGLCAVERALRARGGAWLVGAVGAVAVVVVHAAPRHDDRAGQVRGRRETLEGPQQRAVLVVREERGVDSEEAVGDGAGGRGGELAGELVGDAGVLPEDEGGVEEPGDVAEENEDAQESDDLDTVHGLNEVTSSFQSFCNRLDVKYRFPIFW